MRKSERPDFQGLFHRALKRLERDQRELGPVVDKELLRGIEGFLQSTDVSDSAKGCYLLLNQFPLEQQGYVVVPNERVRVRDTYRREGPSADYELDFAVYAGTRTRPVKIAVEVTPIDYRHSVRLDTERRKDIDLQASGWIVLRLSESEILDELAKVANNEPSWKLFLVIENIILNVGDQLTPQTVYWPDIRAGLTGYRRSRQTCSACETQQEVIDDLPAVCKTCGAVLSSPENGAG